MGYLRTDDEDTVISCPECDSAGSVYERTDMKRSQGTEPYACHECSAEFSEPVRRDAREWQPQRDASARAWQAHRRTVLGLDAGGE